MKKLKELSRSTMWMNSKEYLMLNELLISSYIFKRWFENLKLRLAGD